MTIETINGRKVGVSRAGTGPPMLLLHCALAHRGVLAPLITKLGEMAFTSFDLPGHGQSEFDQSTDIQRQACETAITLLEQADGPSHIFGHSFGGTVALKVALMRPDLVRTLSLYEPVYFSLLAKANPTAYAAEAKAAEGFTTAAQAGNWPEAARAFLARWSMEGFDTLPSAQRAYVLQTIPLIMASAPSIVEPESGADTLAGLAELRCPVLLMQGGCSPAVIGAINQAIASRAPDAQLHKLNAAGHMGPITHAGAVAALMVGHML